MKAGGMGEHQLSGVGRPVPMMHREGDVAVIGDVGTVIGAAQADHDLSALADARLRSHGGVTEARVPFILNRPLNAGYAARAAAASPQGGMVARTQGCRPYSSHSQR